MEQAAVSNEERQAALSQRVAQFAKGGWRVESQTDLQAVLVKGHRPNHLLHLVLTVLTLGLWAIVWIIVATTSKERRAVLTVNQAGEVRGV
jgi:hypothetical protein